MDKTLKRMIWFGLTVAVVGFWAGLFLGLDVLLEYTLAVGVSIAVLGALCALWLKAKAHLESPEFAEATERVASQAADAGTALSDVTHGRLLPMTKYLFTFKGRVTRREYWITQIAIGIVDLGSVIWIILEPYHFTPWFLMLVSGVSLLAFGARRTRDTGVNQWWFLLVLVAPVNLALLVFLLLVPTDEFRDVKI